MGEGPLEKSLGNSHFGGTFLGGVGSLALKQGIGGTGKGDETFYDVTVRDSAPAQAYLPN
jgi:hypothetical protein